MEGSWELPSSTAGGGGTAGSDSIIGTAAGLGLVDYSSSSDGEEQQQQQQQQQQQPPQDTDAAAPITSLPSNTDSGT